MLVSRRGFLADKKIPSPMSCVVMIKIDEVSCIIRRVADIAVCQKSAGEVDVVSLFPKSCAVVEVLSVSGLDS